jgi:hypothetical protein
MFKTMPPYRMPEDYTTKVHFMPWVGCNYISNALFDFRILILGESHYSKQYFDKSPDITKYYTHYIMQHWAVNNNSAFYSKVRNSILRGNGLSVNGYEKSELRQKFWDSVAFFNYVQEFVGTGARNRPQPQQWLSAETAYWEVLEKLKPDICIVLGEELWRHLPKSDGVRVSSRKDEITGKTFKHVVVKGHETILAHTPHPASFGLFKKNKVVPIIKRLLELDSAAERPGRT